MGSPKRSASSCTALLVTLWPRPGRRLKAFFTDPTAQGGGRVDLRGPPHILNQEGGSTPLVGP